MPRENQLQIVSELTDDDYIRIIDGLTSKRINKNDLIAQFGSLPAAPDNIAVLGESVAYSLVPASLQAFLPYEDPRWHGATGGPRYGTGYTHNDRPGIQAAIDAAALNGKYVLIPPGLWLVDMPLLVRSGVRVVGSGKGTLIRNTLTLDDVNDDDISTINGACFMYGVYHPSFTDDVVADSFTIPAPGVRNITRTSSTVSFAVGDTIIVFDSVTPGDNPNSKAQFIRQIIGIVGDVLILDKPLDRWFTTHAQAHVTKGDGYVVTYTPVGSAPVEVELAACTDAGISDLAVETATFYWITRGFGRDCKASRIFVVDSGALVFGSGLENCTFEDISGYFRNRFVELTDGGRDNHCRRITGTCTEGSGWEASDPLIWMGIGSTLDEFDVTDWSARSVWVNMVRDHMKISNGHLRLDATTNNVLQYGDAGSDIPVLAADVFNIDIHCQGLIGADVIRLLNADRCVLRDIRVHSDGGYDLGTDSTLSINVGNTNCIVDNLSDPNGRLDYAVGASADPSQVALSNISWITATDEPVHAGSQEFIAAANAPSHDAATARLGMWFFDSGSTASTEGVSAVVRLPPAWNTYAVKLLWANAGAGTGDVTWRIDRQSLVAGATVATPSSGTQVPLTAGAQNVIVESTVLTTGTNPANGTINVVLARVGSAVTDTLGNDAAMIALRFERLT